ncbi:MAG: hypothetical protein EAZ76_04695 [Nostocales cyanobacterium]|nr:MAG: hypothetical protein EAZ87_19205 [Nostocales cyanobacterium]TAF18553.1 MAG: hypothetical protein EAZ76_04695 [Nostocales cyanobacterium]
MTTKELLIQEINSMSETELIETLNLVRTIKQKQSKPPHHPGSGKSILRHAAKWVGDDIKECLEIVEFSRGLTRFDIEEREEWVNFSLQNLNQCYAENEPEYTLASIKEYNPEAKFPQQDTKDY